MMLPTLSRLCTSMPIRLPWLASLLFCVDRDVALVGFPPRKREASRFIPSCDERRQMRSRGVSPLGVRVRERRVARMRGGRETKALKPIDTAIGADRNFLGHSCWSWGQPSLGPLRVPPRALGARRAEPRSQAAGRPGSGPAPRPGRGQSGGADAPGSGLPRVRADAWPGGGVGGPAAPRSLISEGVCHVAASSAGNPGGGGRPGGGLSPSRSRRSRSPSAGVAATIRRRPPQRRHSRT